MRGETAAKIGHHLTEPGKAIGFPRFNPQHAFDSSGDHPRSHVRNRLSAGEVKLGVGIKHVASPAVACKIGKKASQDE